MKKTATAFLVGLMLGMKGVTKLQHLFYWLVILFLLIHFHWSGHFWHN